MITGPTTGYVEATIEELRIANAGADKAQKGDTITFPLREKIRPSDKLYKIVDA